MTATVRKTTATTAAQASPVKTVAQTARSTAHPRHAGTTAGTLATRDQERLDQALEQTFPASDPIAPGTAMHAHRSQESSTARPTASAHGMGLSTQGQGRKGRVASVRGLGAPLADPSLTPRANARAKQKEQPDQPMSTMPHGKASTTTTRANHGPSTAKVQAGPHGHR